MISNIIIFIVIVAIGGGAYLMLAHHINEKKRIHQIKLNFIQEKRNIIYFEQCIIHIMNKEDGIFDAKFNLITNNALKNDLYLIYLGFNLNTDKKRSQNKIIKQLKNIIYEKHT